MHTIIIEQTKEYKMRMVYDPHARTFTESKYGSLAWERGFPHPYGWLKGTGTPPGEHLDIYLLSYFDCALGDELPVKVVGVFKRNDGDHKLIGIDPDRPETDFAQLPQHEKDDLARLYPRASEGEGWFGREAAGGVIAHFMRHGRDGKKG